jgi:hypothetical protein
MNSKSVSAVLAGQASIVAIVMLALVIALLGAPQRLPGKHTSLGSL